ncbi:MAG: helix-turn-helix domain-containing protein [Ignavibacteriales bacterium]|nr:helix-turn-helix domain-containing protein [Ignavibacteriales bacterium]
MYNQRTMYAGEWYWVAKGVIWKYPSLVGFSALAVYFFLASMADERQSCFPSQKYIADHLGCSRATVNRAIQKLTMHKLIALEKKDRMHNRYYLLHVERCTKGIQMSHKRNSPVLKVDTNNTNQQEINNNTIAQAKKKELLAQEIAEILNDQENRKTYLQFANRYPEEFLRKIAAEVKLTPFHKIKKSRCALFTYLIRHYENSRT